MDVIGAARSVLLPVEIERTAATILQGAALLVAVIRGLDYLALPDHVMVENLGTVEAALPFRTWGALFIIAGLIGLLGLAVRRLPVAASAHGALAGLYAAFGTGALIDVIARGELYGWRTGAGWILGGAVLHAVLAEASLDASRRIRG